MNCVGLSAVTWIYVVQNATDTSKLKMFVEKRYPTCYLHVDYDAAITRAIHDKCHNNDKLSIINRIRADYIYTRW